MMGYYDEAANTKAYMQMIENEQNFYLVNQTLNCFEKQMKVLELGSGAGHDLKKLDENFEVVGSDNAEPFIRYLKDTFYDLRILRLNAITMDTHKQFDAIYSNKVLHHLPKEDLKQSLQNQSNVLTSRGLMLHGFWQNIDALDTPKDLIFNTYNEKSIKAYIPDNLKVLKFEVYQEYEEADSFYILLQKKD